MKSLKTGSLCRRIAVVCALAGGFQSAYGVTTNIVVGALSTTVTYTFSKDDVLAGVPGTFTKYANSVTGADGFSLVDPNSSSADTFIKHSWYSNIDVPNSQQARIDGAVGSFYDSIGGITMSYHLAVVNWIAIDNSNNSVNIAKYTVSSTASIYRNFNNDINTPAGNLVDSANDSLTSGTLIFPADGATETPADAGTVFPFVSNFVGTDAKVFAPHLTGQAHPQTGGEAVADPIDRIVTKTGFALTGADFTAYQGVAPGSVTTSMTAVGSGNLSSGTGFSSSFRAFSTGDLSITFTFVPEAETWAAGLAVAGMTFGGLVRRRLARKTA